MRAEFWTGRFLALRCKFRAGFSHGSLIVEQNSVKIRIAHSASRAALCDSSGAYLYGR